MIGPIRQGERTITSTYTGTAGTLEVVTTLLVTYDQRDGYNKEVEERVMRTDLHFEGVKPPVASAIVVAFSQKDYLRVSALLNGLDPNEAAPAADILSLTKDFINDQTKS